MFHAAAKESKHTTEEFYNKQVDQAEKNQEFRSVATAYKQGSPSIGLQKKLRGLPYLLSMQKTPTTSGHRGGGE